MQAFGGWYGVGIRKLSGERVHRKWVWNEKARNLRAWYGRLDDGRVTSDKMSVLGSELVKRSEVKAHMLWVAEAGELLAQKRNRNAPKPFTGAGLKRFRRAVRKVMVARRFMAFACRSVDLHFDLYLCVCVWRGVICMLVDLDLL